MKKLALALALVAGCATRPQIAPCNSGLALLNASLWVQTSAEYKAVATQTFNTGRRMLDERLTDADRRPPAVVLDVDETILDNTEFEARKIRAGITYDLKEWLKWTNESAGRAIPGAAEFLAHAKSRGVTPFFITNRKTEEEAGTLANLQRLGFPATADTLLVRGERPEWASSDKSPRRQWVSSAHRVLLVFGDDLNDFVNAQGLNLEQRDARVRENSAKWGSEWLILPNPMYGSWEKAITGDGTPECEALQKKIEALQP